MAKQVNPRPFRSGPPEVPGIVQQLLQTYSTNNLINQRAYSNITTYLRAERDDSAKFKRAVEAARAIEANRGPIPFGTLMAVVEHETANSFNPACYGPQTIYGQMRGPYQIGDGTFPATWTKARNSGLKEYQVTLAEATDFAAATFAVAKGKNRPLGKMHDFMVWLIPSIIRDDPVLYTYCIYCANLAGPGGPQYAQAALSENPPKVSWGKGKFGAAPNVVRAIGYGGGKLTLEGMLSTGYNSQPDTGRSNMQSSMGLFDVALRYAIWNARKDKLLAGDTRGMNDIALLTQALENAKSKGQEVALASLRGRVFSVGRAQGAVVQTRKDGYQGGKQDGNATQQHAEKSGANLAKQAALAKAAIENMRAPAGPVQAYDWSTGLWTVVRST